MIERCIGPGICPNPESPSDLSTTEHSTRATCDVEDDLR
jgi:hypothetical protein